MSCVFSEPRTARSDLHPEIRRGKKKIEEETTGQKYNVRIANICTRGPQSLSCLRARRDHDPALPKALKRLAK